MNIKAEIDFQEATKDLDNLNLKQLPFAISTGINDTAFQSMRNVRAQIPKKFDLKSKYIIRGVRVQKSNKKQISPRAYVYHKDDFLAKQEFGTTEHYDGLTPTKTVKHRGRSARVPKTKFAGSLLAGYKGPRAAGKLGGRGKRRKGRTKYFSYRGTKSSTGFGFIARRQNRRKKNNRQLFFAFDYVKKQEFKKRFDFNKIVVGTAKSTGPRFIRNRINTILS